MVLDIFNNIEGVTIILSGLLPNNAHPQCNKELNDGYGYLVNSLAAEGKKIIYANLQYDWIDLADGTHPNDEGYKKLAAVWFRAIDQARQKDFITDPAHIDSGKGENGVCDKKPGEYDLSGQTQRGSGADDGPYKHKGQAMGTARLFISPIHVKDLGQTLFVAKVMGGLGGNLVWYAGGFCLSPSVPS
jgi:hypothetical protein